MLYSCKFTQGNSKQESISFQSLSDLYHYLFQHREFPDLSIAITKELDDSSVETIYTGNIEEFLKR